jgi:N-acylglucosamine 2-epimerase
VESADETTREYLSGLRERYRRELLGSVVPFWMRHALDPAGGINTCIADDGRVLSRDRFLWSQLRAIWTFSALYNRIERRSEWLDAARGIFEFCLAHGRDAEGRWAFRLSPDGAVLEGPTSIYADGFAIIGLAEFARATDDERAIRAAIETFEEVERRLEHPGSYGTAPYAVPEGAKAHAISMIFSYAFFELAELLDDEVVMDSAIAHHREVMDCFLRREDGLVREFVSLDGSLIDSPQGRAVVPGHAVESMWFQMHIMRRGGEARDIARACECIRRHVELAWDGEFGGLVLARDAEGAEPWWPYADTKLWWPHTEALYALLLAYEFTRADWALEWLRKIDEYAFAHYPVKEHGEWTQRLDRQGRRLDAVVALPVKDPFHLPRSLVMCLEVLGRLAEEQG